MSSFRQFVFAACALGAGLSLGLTTACAPKQDLDSSTQASKAFHPTKPTATAPAKKAPAPREEKMDGNHIVASVVLTRGITGGIVAPHVSLKAIVVEHESGSIELHVKREKNRRDGASHHRTTLGKQNYEELWSKVEELSFWDMPREIPMGIQDIYGFDVSLSLRRGDRAWRNGAPNGCVHGESKVQANAKERERFKSLLDYVEKLAGEATAPSTREDFEAVRRQAEPPAQVRGVPGLGSR